jgi:hypothetical protein
MKTELLAYARETCAGSRFRTPMMSWPHLVETSELVVLGTHDLCLPTCIHPKAPKEMIQVLQFLSCQVLAAVFYSHNVG